MSLAAGAVVADAGAGGAVVRTSPDRDASSGALHVTRESVTLRRAPFGGAPLYYATDGERVLVASRLAPLARALDAHALDLDELSALLAGTEDPLDLEATCYAAVKRVPSGHEVRVEPSGRRVLREVPVEPRRGVHTSSGDAAVELRARLRAAVARAIAGKRRVAVLVSGGLDSSGILATAVAEARGARACEIEALARDFAGPGDDRPYLRALEADLGIEVIRKPPSFGAELVRDTLVVDGAPLPAPDTGNLVAMMRDARLRGAEVVLTGLCGDDVLDGDPRYAAASMARDPIAALRDLWLLREPWQSTFSERLVGYLARPLLSGLYPLRALRARRRRLAPRRWSFAGPRLLDWLDRRMEASSQSGFAVDAGERVRSFATWPAFTRIADLCGQYEVAAGIAVANPLLDPELVAFVQSLSPALLQAGHRTRGLFREALRGLVPDVVRLRPDKGIQDPAVGRLVERAGGFAALADLVDVPHASGLGLVDRAAILEMARALEVDPLAGGWGDLWRVLAVEAFLRRHAAGGASTYGASSGGPRLAGGC